MKLEVIIEYKTIILLIQLYEHENGYIIKPFLMGGMI